MTAREPSRERALRSLDALTSTGTYDVTSLDALRRIVGEGRLPRVAVLGRRGSGKSTLLHEVAGAVLGATDPVRDATATARWHTVTLRDGRRAHWLDTPGLRAGAQATSSRVAQVRALLDVERPDLVVLTVPATEADAGIDEDLAAARAMVVDETIPWWVLATRCDELPPPDELAPPWVEKRAAIGASVTLLHRHALGVGRDVVGALPLSLARDDAWDGRWNHDAFSARLAALLPDRTARDRVAEVRARVSALLRGLARAVSDGDPATRRDRFATHLTAWTSLDAAALSRALPPPDAAPWRVSMWLATWGRVIGALESAWLDDASLEGLSRPT